MGGETCPIIGDKLVSSGCWSAMCWTVSTIDSGGDRAGDVENSGEFSTSPALRVRSGGAIIAESDDNSKP